MKTVLLLRHAKSSWDHPGLDDFRRPLAPRGRKAAARMGRFLAESRTLPDRVLCSGALRAVQTWELVSESLGEKIPTEIREDIYHASPGTLLRLIRTLPEDSGSALLVGHNPTFEMLALRLASPSGNDTALRTMKTKYPTAALAVLDFSVETWRAVEEGGGTLRDFIRPRDLE